MYVYCIQTQSSRPPTLRTRLILGVERKETYWHTQDGRGEYWLVRKNSPRIHVSRAWKVLEKVKSVALTLLTSVCDRFLPSLRLSFRSQVFHNPPRTINMETSSRAFTNGPEGNLLLTLSDDNSSLQLRPKSAKNRIIPIITIITTITILANRQGALAVLGKPTYLITSRMSLFLHPFLQRTKKRNWGR